MSELSRILDTYRAHAKSEREKGAYFEKLVQCYLRNEATYKDLYEEVWLYPEWAKSEGLRAQDAGIDLVAKTRTGDLHAVQCKLYAPDYELKKADIDSFFTASGKKPFTHRLIFSTTSRWSVHAAEALRDQQPPVTKIDLRDLETSQIDWGRYAPDKPAAVRPKKTLRPHQKDAVAAVKRGLAKADRGKMIMACGTGKTFAALKIAEEIAGKDGRVLFLVPSLALMSQTLTEWTQESGVPLHSFAVCSDSEVGKKRSADDDRVTLMTHELRFPATTDAKSLAQQVKQRHDTAHMTVVFSTYHSIDVIGRAQADYKLPDFDLVICDEAHRTTGAIFEDEEESAFVRVHDEAFLRANKRLYMTATPRIYTDAAKISAERDSVELCSMDDPEKYGETLYALSFSNAVKLGLLVDYKVIVLAVEESAINRRLQKLLADENNQLKVEDAGKIVGCWKALSKQGLRENLVGDERPMKRAVAFCQVISLSTKAKSHKISSKNIAAMFQEVVETYQRETPEERCSKLMCTARHVDGTMGATEKQEKLDWLREEIPDGESHILSNVRCLSEGVDVPALDAVLFLTPRNSQVDVVQSVGRVMRIAEGKHRGYVILPVVIPAGVEPHEALNDNKTYAVVWQVLQALRSHDDRFDAMVNKMELDLNRSMLGKIEVIALKDDVPVKKRGQGKGKQPDRIGDGGLRSYGGDRQMDIQFEIGELERAIYARIVQKCGNRHHWEEWANDIAKIARTHIDRINAIVENPANAKERSAFAAFAAELRDDLNDSITDGEVVEMLAQHLITKPVFDALFADYSFLSHNPISNAMRDVLEMLRKHHIEKEADTLESFYESVRQRAAGIESAAGKQTIIHELYDKFFRNAFPKLRERLGIVYTPVEVVDFIIHSVDHLLQKEFGQTLGSKGIHIIDPFTGTGTFITRLLQSGLIKPEELKHKYKHEIHANEIVLLAYYIAAINIEATYHALTGGEYVPFDGICLTDTFQLYEHEDLISKLLVDNSARRTRQKKLDIRVIISNPPYSVGQESANDNNPNVSYPILDERIRTTYVAYSNSSNKNSLYNSYIRAIRWASDRVGKSGIVGFVTAAGFVDNNTADGLRQCLAEEFSSIYVFHLRGNQRTSGETSRREGGKIFDSRSRAPIAIAFLIKNPAAKKHGEIFVHDIGDYLSREEKLQMITKYRDVVGIAAAGGWTSIVPDAHGDWVRLRDDDFGRFMAIGDKSSDSPSVVFLNYSSGVKTQRDAWCYNSSKRAVGENMSRTIDFYNQEVVRLHKAHRGYERKALETAIDSFVDTDQTKISWSDGLKAKMLKAAHAEFEPEHLTPSLYRPFNKQWLYYNRFFNERVYQMPRIFPDAAAENLVIVVTGIGESVQFSTLMSDKITELKTHYNSQCFPLYLYDTPPEEVPDLFNRKGKGAEKRTRRVAITDEGLKHFQSAYPGEKIAKEDIFYYVYGLLHSPDYRGRYADNLSKELPRIPCVMKAAGFWEFSKAGRELAALHVGYEKVPMHPVTIDAKANLPASAYRVEKMRYGKTKANGKTVSDKSVLVYNEHITLRDIPLAAYEYVVNGKSALDWVVERQCVKTDKDSGIVNDANDWAVETMHNPKYPLELFMRVITVSLETMKIVNTLPALDI